MQYYKIKIQSPLSENNTIHNTNDTKLEKKDAEPYIPDSDIEETISGFLSSRKKFLSYSSKSGFFLSSEIAACVFSDDDIKNDVVLQEYLSDKEYEYIETDQTARVMRYRRE